MGRPPPHEGRVSRCPDRMEALRPQLPELPPKPEADPIDVPPRIDSGGGATTQVGPAGTLMCEPPVAESGMIGAGEAIPTIFGVLPFPSVSSGALRADCCCPDFWPCSEATRIAGA